jgi:hypothetical protein
MWRRDVIEADLPNWDELLVRYDKLVNYRENQILRPDTIRVSTLLFRGQQNTKWPLDTTLQRYTPTKVWTCNEYFRCMHAVKAQVETYTGKLWQDVPTPDDYDARLKERKEIEVAANPLNLLPGLYEHMVYLRHYGFPSPLLDWSQSLYIAAFFAFRHASPDQSEPVAIYAFLEWTGDTNPGGPTRVIGLGPNVRSHKRHFLQQSEYTICCTRSDEGVWSYDSHEKVLQGKNPKRLWKFSVPVSERARVLHLLDRSYNINASSLFGSEESLMETVAARAFLHPR